MNLFTVNENQSLVKVKRSRNLQKQNDTKAVPLTEDNAAPRRGTVQRTDQSFCYYQIIHEMRVIINMTMPVALAVLDRRPSASSSCSVLSSGSNQWNDRPFGTLLPNGAVSLHRQTHGQDSRVGWTIETQHQ